MVHVGSSSCAIKIIKSAETKSAKSIHEYLQPNNTIIFIKICNAIYICQLSSHVTSNVSKDSQNDCMEIVFDASIFIPLQDIIPKEDSHTKMNMLDVLQNYPAILINKSINDVPATKNEFDTIKSLKFPIILQSESTKISNMFDNDYVIFMNSCNNITQHVSSITLTKVKLCNEGDNDNKSNNGNETEYNDPRKLLCIKREFVNKIIMNDCIIAIPNSISINEEKAFYYKVTSIFPTSCNNLYRIYPSTTVTLIQEEMQYTLCKIIHSTPGNISEDKKQSSNNIINTTSSEAERKLKETIQYIQEMRLAQQQTIGNFNEIHDNFEKDDNIPTSEAENQLKDTINYIENNLLKGHEYHQNEIIQHPLKENQSNEAESIIQTTINCIHKIRHKSINLDIPRTFLFNGPPGVGKTFTITKIIQNNPNIKCLPISGWCTPQTLRDTFDQILDFVTKNLAKINKLEKVVSKVKQLVGF